MKLKRQMASQSNYYIYIYKDGIGGKIPFKHVNKVKACQYARSAAKEHLEENANCGWSVHNSSGKAVAAGQWIGGVYHSVDAFSLSTYDVDELE